MEIITKKAENRIFTENEQNIYYRQVELYASRSCNSSLKYNKANCLNTSPNRPLENYPDMDPMLYRRKEENGSSITAKSFKKNLSKSYFFKWLKVRENTLKELETLVREFHNEQWNYNKAQKVCREIGKYSRYGKMVPSLIGFMASAISFLSDAAHGIASFAQASNVDYYEKKFKKIVSYDEEFAEGLYESRFLRQIGDSIRSDDNPVTFSSTTVVGAISLSDSGKSKSGVMRAIGMCSDQLMIMEDEREINRLQRQIDWNFSQTTLEDQIMDVIDTLRSEMEEVIEAYTQYYMSMSAYDILRSNSIISMIIFFLVFQVISMFDFGNIWGIILSLVLTACFTYLLCRSMFPVEVERRFQFVVILVIFIFIVIVMFTFSFWVTSLILILVYKLYTNME